MVHSPIYGEWLRQRQVWLVANLRDVVYCRMVHLDLKVFMIKACFFVHMKATEEQTIGDRALVAFVLLSRSHARGVLHILFRAFAVPLAVKVESCP